MSHHLPTPSPVSTSALAALVRRALGALVVLTLCCAAGVGLTAGAASAAAPVSSSVSGSTNDDPTDPGDDNGMDPGDDDGGDADDTGNDDGMGDTPATDEDPLGATVCQDLLDDQAVAEKVVAKHQKVQERVAKQVTQLSKQLRKAKSRKAQAKLRKQLVVVKQAQKRAAQAVKAAKADVDDVVADVTGCFEELTDTVIQTLCDGGLPQEICAALDDLAELPTPTPGATSPFQDVCDELTALQPLCDVTAGVDPEAVADETMTDLEDVFGFLGSYTLDDLFGLLQGFGLPDLGDVSLDDLGDLGGLLGGGGSGSGSGGGLPWWPFAHSA